MASPGKEHDQWFADEVRPHESSLRAFLMRSLGSAADVDDLVQESYIRILVARKAGEIRSSKNFLFTIARNAIRDLIRRRAVAVAIPFTENAPIAVLDDSPGVADLVSRRQELELLADAIRALPERCREVFLLRKIQAIPQKEIARRLGISENTVETLVARGARSCADYVRSRSISNHANNAPAR
jgi:RNA polymerase sigma factor (sigma-70 family)